MSVASLSKLTDADGEQQETQHWLETAFDCGYLSGEELQDLLGRCQRVGKLLGGMVEKADLFCGEIKPNLRELVAEYSIDGDGE